MSTRYEHRHLELACNLARLQAGTRAGEWPRLQADRGLGMERITGGARLWVELEGLQAVEDLVRRESECCGFLDLELSVQADRVQVDITSPVGAAETVIASLVGLDNPGAPCC